MHGTRQRIVRCPVLTGVDQVGHHATDCRRRLVPVYRVNPAAHSRSATSAMAALTSHVRAQINLCRVRYRAVDDGYGHHARVAWRRVGDASPTWSSIHFSIRGRCAGDGAATVVVVVTAAGAEDRRLSRHRDLPAPASHPAVSKHQRGEAPRRVTPRIWQAPTSDASPNP